MSGEPPDLNNGFDGTTIDPRLLDARQTPYTIQVSDLGPTDDMIYNDPASNVPLRNADFGSTGEMRNDGQLTRPTHDEHPAL